MTCHEVFCLPRLSAGRIRPLALAIRRNPVIKKSRATIVVAARRRVRGAAKIIHFKFWSFPNRNFFLQLIHYPLTGSECFAAVRSCHSQKKRWFPNGDKSDSVMNDNKLKWKFLRGLPGNLSQLMFGHFAMRFILNPVDFSSIFKSPYHSPKVVYRSCVASVAFRRL